jgi:hypothetical protein
MKLVRADGHQQQQWSLANPYTQTVVSLLHAYMDDTDLLPTIARVLQDIHGELFDRLDQELAHVRELYEAARSEEEDAIPAYVTELLDAIYELYHQPRSVLFPNQREQINSLRGAVVERLGLELIKHRYRGNDECANSRRFLDKNTMEITLQEVDVAALSCQRGELEGYECKLKAMALANHDCLDLECLYRAAAEEEFRAQVGVISFDATKMVERRLRHFQTAPCVLAYGVDGFDELEYNPFD